MLEEIDVRSFRDLDYKPKSSPPRSRTKRSRETSRQVRVMQPSLTGLQDSVLNARQLAIKISGACFLRDLVVLWLSVVRGIGVVRDAGAELLH